MKRRLVNLVTRSWAGWTRSAERVYSVRRLDPHHNFFYGSAEAALQVADDAAKKNEPFPATQTLQLPSPTMNFSGDLGMFALLSQGRMVYANTTGEAGMYDADRHLQYCRLPRLNSPKGLKPMCLSVAERSGGGEQEHSMYVMDRFPLKGAAGRCFEVLQLRRVMRHSILPPWRWRLLPPPPFLDEPDDEHASGSVVAFAAAVADGDGDGDGDGNNGGRSTIYISCCGGIGTYGFDTGISDSIRRSQGSEEAWSHVGEWKLPFRDRAQYIPEFNLWFGFLASSPNHLCAVDLSSAAMHRGQGRPPAVQQVWQDLADPREGEEWFPWQLELVDLGDGKFLIVKIFQVGGGIGGERFALLTGVEMIPCVGGESLQMVKHKCARFVFGTDTIEWVL